MLAESFWEWVRSWWIDIVECEDDALPVGILVLFFLENVVVEVSVG